MQKNTHCEDPYIGIEPIKGYYLTKRVGQGKIGSVYTAVRSGPSQNLSHTLACKVIPMEKLKSGWELEVQKVLRLDRVPNVVRYFAHDSTLDKNNRPVCCIISQFIPSINLREYLEKPIFPLDMALVELIIKTILSVLFACRQAGIEHGDLHEGNVLISDPEDLQPGSPRVIWISDFGCGGSHNELEPRDDYRQLFSIASSLLRRLSPSELTARDRVMHQKLAEYLRKKLLETDHTQGKFVGNPDSLLHEFKILVPAAERESAAATKGDESKEPGDYLVAEALGYRADEWRSLFVPEFLAAKDLLSRNVTVLTGARGCGKTMTFRRLTLFMDRVIGEPSGVDGADEFIGFYLNCRDLVEAFPWLPNSLNRATQQQIIHYFHLAWLSEICRTLAICDSERNGSYVWLDGLLIGTFGDRYHPLPIGADNLTHAQAFIESEKERCRLAPLGKEEGLAAWPLARTDFLDTIHGILQSNVSWIGEKPLYFFLDDYTIPIVTREVQRVLNPLIFKRRSSYFFKVSTEAANSFLKVGLRGKPMEIHQDFEFIDLATSSLYQSVPKKTKLLDEIFRPRIDRHPLLKGKNLGLQDLLGTMPDSNNKLAFRLRNAVEKGEKSPVLYHGEGAFVGMWASDIRIMIQMFVDMLREANGTLKKGETFEIPYKIQNKCYKAAGGEFLEFSESVADPSTWEKGPSSTKPGEAYGTHLRNIAEAFIKVSKYELTKGELVSNQGTLNPKQAFRLEIVDKFELPHKASRYYEGLLRWHIFLQDWRGKSVRGMITPRLYLNRVLIPFANLTFSSHDNIQLTNEEFTSMLQNPQNFPKIYQAKRGASIKHGHKNKRANEKTTPLIDF